MATLKNPRDPADAEPKVAPCPDKKCSLPVDFLFEAENGTHFGAHRRNLELYSGAFQPLVDVAPVDFESGFQVMRVTERRGVVSLMLRYMHNHWQPMIDKLGFDVLKDLAEAVEKYEIYSAIEVCRFRMREEATSHPLQVLQYAVKYDYPDLADRAAPSTIDETLITMSTLLDEQIIAWTHYREGLLDVFHGAHTPPPAGPHQKCELWDGYHLSVLMGLGGTPSSLWNFEKYVRSKRSLIAGCGDCISRSRKWQTRVVAKRDGLPAFSTFIWGQREGSDGGS